MASLTFLRSNEVYELSLSTPNLARRSFFLYNIFYEIWVYFTFSFFAKIMKHITSLMIFDSFSIGMSIVRNKILHCAVKRPKAHSIILRALLAFD